MVCYWLSNTFMKTLACQLLKGQVFFFFNDSKKTLYPHVYTRVNHMCIDLLESGFNCCCLIKYLSYKKIKVNSFRELALSPS